MLGDTRRSWKHSLPLLLVCAKPILNITQTYIPTLEPQDTLGDARSLFESKQYNLDVIPIVEGTAC